MSASTGLTHAAFCCPCWSAAICPKSRSTPELLVDYNRESDVLTFGNREPVTRSHEMAPGLTAHIDGRELAGSFTMENASVILLHHFRNPIDREDNALAATAAKETEA